MLQTKISNSMEKAENSSKGVENIMGKGEIALDKQFLLFPVFSRLVLQTHENGLLWERVKDPGRDTF